MVRRFSLADLPDTIPVFPLPGALLLPRARLPLNIFEPRYLAMLDDAMKSEHRLIGMVQPRGDDQQPPKLQKIGCAGRVTSLSETEDGRYLIVLSGIARFRIEQELEGFSPYRRVRVQWSDFAADLGSTPALPGFEREEFLELLRKFFEVASLSSDWDSLRDADPELLINSLSMMCPFQVEEKQALLESPSLSDRCETLTALFRFAIAAGGEGGPLQ